MARELKTKTLDEAAKYYASVFVQDRKDGPVVNRTRYTTGRKEGEPTTVQQFSREWVMLQFFNFTFKDEFDYIVAAVRQQLGPDPLAVFNAELAKFTPRTEEMFQQMLAETGQA
jgi:hypothetical protein